MRKIVCVLLVMAVAISFSSCINDVQWGDEDGLTKKEETQVVLQIKSPSIYSELTSRALTQEMENKIENVYVLAFDRYDNLSKIVQGENVTNTPLGSGSFVVTLTGSTGVGDTYKLVVLTNASSTIGSTIGFNALTVSNKSYSNIITRINEAFISRLYPSGGAIPMWGETGQLIIEEGMTPDPIVLTRSIARVDVGVGGYDTGTSSWNGRDEHNNPIPFVLKSVYVVRPNNRYAVIPGIAERISGTPTIAAGTSAYSVQYSETNFRFAVSSGYSTMDIYIPETDIAMDNGAGTARPGDMKHRSRMALVVGGLYNGSGTETFYRIDFEKDDILLNVLRNHFYRFNIADVTGPGYIDVPTAYNSISINMIANVLDWNENNVNIIFDKQYYLDLSISRIDFLSAIAAKPMVTLEIKTNYDGAYSSSSPAGSTTDLINDSGQLGGGWLNYMGSSNQTVSGGVYTRTIMFSSYTSGIKPPVSFNIMAGNIKYTFRITQN